MSKNPLKTPIGKPYKQAVLRSKNKVSENSPIIIKCSRRFSSARLISSAGRFIGCREDGGYSTLSDTVNERFMFQINVIARQPKWKIFVVLKTTILARPNFLSTLYNLAVEFSIVLRSLAISRGGGAPNNFLYSRLKHGGSSNAARKLAALRPNLRRALNGGFPEDSFVSETTQQTVNLPRIY